MKQRVGDVKSLSKFRGVVRSGKKIMRLGWFQLVEVSPEKGGRLCNFKPVGGGDSLAGRTWRNGLVLGAGRRSRNSYVMGLLS